MTNSIGDAIGAIGETLTAITQGAQIGFAQGASSQILDGNFKDGFRVSV
ncbi:hypothetical protein HUE58_01965 [Candidatus Ruthia endofausta]|uniref:Uncharacterized protein n=1 Tax=Candidatus Ruthia endofausta TaxID=2738852 RepID=A0A6N0HNT9_9GAMM|nr:hypothetical protein [Candidatus Ruthia endofausta]QKQ23957.1 hypothetical protein HUE58_01965 [Candidatus Ruthia endofausta]